MPIASLADVLNSARREGIGVPNLWGGTTEKTLGHIRAAEELRAPISLCYVRALCPELSMEYGFEMIIDAAKRSTVPIAAILDHGANVEECVGAICAGASGVMYDGSHLPFEENVQNTGEVVRFAHAAGVSVEAELGSVGGSALEYGTDDALQGQLTEPEKVVEFVERTGVDALAISVGNAHGAYKGAPNIRHDLIRTIRRKVDIPLVMHGASGLPETEYARIVESGITKINYYSGMSAAAVEALRVFLGSDDGSIGCHNVLRHMIEWYTNETRRLLTLLGARGNSERSRLPPPRQPDPASVGISREQIAAIVADVVDKYRRE